MKNRIIILVIIGIMISMLFMIPKSTYASLFKKEEPSIGQISKASIDVYMKGENDQLVMVKAYVDTVLEDSILQKFNVLTKKCGTFDKPYDTYLCSSSQLISYTLSNNVLSLNVSEEFKDSFGRKALEQLVWTYCNDEITNIELYIDDQKLTSLNNYQFDYLSKDMGVNLTFESAFFLPGKDTTIITHHENEVIPVTYLYSNGNVYDFIIGKLFSDQLEIDYEYEVKDNELVVSLLTPITISTDLRASIQDTLAYNINLGKITICSVDDVLLTIE